MTRSGMSGTDNVSKGSKGEDLSQTFRCLFWLKARLALRFKVCSFGRASMVGGFLRETSNASDALGKIRSESVFYPDKIEAEPKLEPNPFLKCLPDRTNSTITIDDSSIGMTKMGHHLEGVGCPG